MSAFCFINGEIIESGKAGLGISDLGLQRGYGVFDYAPVYNGKVFHLEDYLSRLQNSAMALHLDIPYSSDEIRNITYHLLAKSRVLNPAIRFLLTGGYSNLNLTLNEPNFLINVEELIGIDKEYYKSGINLATYEYQREIPEVKTLNYLNSIRLEPFKKEKNVHDVLYYNNHGITECPRNNIFIVRDNRLVTPDSHILKGITRKIIIRMAKEEIKVEERSITMDELFLAEEVFITSTRKRVLPVVEIDERKISDGKPGKFTKNMMDLFDNYIQNYS